MGFLRAFWSGFSRFTFLLIGRWHWQLPGWIAVLRRQLETFWRSAIAEPKRAVAVQLGLLGLLGGYVWYRHRPEPNFVQYTVTAPPLTTYDDNGIASIQPLKIDFSESAALLRLVEKRVTKGVDMSPAIAGTWFWTTDRQLQFTPKSDWPIDAGFTVRLGRNGLFTPDVRLEEYSFQFKTQPFYARIDQNLFYQDPSDPNLKKLVATVKFSHPVDTEQFAKHVSLSLPFDAGYLGLKPDSRQFTVAYDKFKLAAYVHSAPLAMPRDDTPMTLRIEKGVRAARGGNETAKRLESVVVIPGRYSLRFSSAHMTLVDNARYEPEQVLLLTTSSPVPEKGMAGKVSMYLLPVRNPKQPKEDKDPYHWNNTKEIGADILSKSDRLSLSYVVSGDANELVHGFKFRAPVARYVYVSIADGVEGTGGYLSGKRYVASIKVDPYPQALTFLGQGALLSLSGDKKLGFLARDIDRVAVEIGRVLPNQLQHIAPMMWDYAHPQVYSDLADSLLERFYTVRDYSGKAPGKPVYDSIDLGPYLRGERQSRPVSLAHPGSASESASRRQRPSSVR